MNEREMIRQSFDTGWMTRTHVTWTPSPPVRNHLYLAFLSGIALGQERQFSFDALKAEVDECFKQMMENDQ